MYSCESLINRTRNHRYPKRKSCKILYRIQLYALFISFLFFTFSNKYLRAEELQRTPALAGPLGLNTIPSARISKPGTARITLSTLAPYIHANFGLQIAEPLFLNFRQTSDSSSMFENPDRLYPGVDLQLRLREESRYAPAITLGLQSAIGHKRMSGEFLSFSKKFHNFDLSGGVAWGRLGSAGHIDNPLGVVFNHFNSARDFDGGEPAGPDDWFTGEKIGFFGGVEYFTPLKGLSIKADWGADRYVAELAAGDFEKPAPWSFGIAYAPFEHASLGAAIVGGDKVLGRLTVQTNFKDWPGRSYKTPEDGALPLRPYRTEMVVPERIRLAAEKEHVQLSHVRHNPETIATDLAYDPDKPLPLQLGRAAKHLANHGGKSAESLLIRPVYFGLTGPAVALNRSDLERAARHKSSAAELWRNASFNADSPEDLVLPDKSVLQASPARQPHRFQFILETTGSLAEEDSGVLYRTAALLDYKRQIAHGRLLSGMRWRLNLKHNLHRLRDFRPLPFFPVRSDIDLFSESRIAPDQLYFAALRTLSKDVYGYLAAGYLEEMYSGYGGEILYRPYGKTWALGAEAFQVFKRQPDGAFNLGHNGDHILTGHVNAWYEIPQTDLTLQAKAGRFLAGDVGARLSLSGEFRGGASMEGFVTVSNRSDMDLFGGETDVFNGVRLRLPIGNLKYLPDASQIHINIEPQGRETAQILNKPLSLYDITDGFSHRELARDWEYVAE